MPGRRPRKARILAIVALATILPALAYAGDAVARRQAWRLHAVGTLSRMADANALAAAALLSRNIAHDRDGHAYGDPSGRQAMRLLDRAVAREPMAADLAALDFIECLGVDGCDAGDRERRLRRIDPGNALGWLVGLRRARQAGDRDAEDAMLASMAQARTFDVYFSRLSGRLRDGLGRLPQPPSPGGPATAAPTPPWNLVYATGLTAAFAMPPLQDITLACRDAAPGSARAADCARVADAFEAGDTLVANALGARMHEWLAVDDAGRARAHAKLRTLYWRMRNWAHLCSTAGIDPMQQIEATFGSPRELDGITRALARANVPLAPPPGWRMRSEQRIVR